MKKIIDRQKAQNATMQELMSTGYVGSASPSGLRDLFSKPSNELKFKSSGASLALVPEEVRGVAEREVQVQVHHQQKQNNNRQDDEQQEQKEGEEQLQDQVCIIRTEPIKPPSITRGPAYKKMENELTSCAGNNDTNDQVTSQVDNNNDTLLPPGSPPKNPYNKNPNTTQQQANKPSISYSTPDHLNPKLPQFSSSDTSCDSPISYNSVLDQNSTPATVRERKQRQQQLQTIQSQEQMMAAENYNNYNDEPHELKIDPMPLSLQNPIKEFDWADFVQGAANSNDNGRVEYYSNGGSHSYGAAAAVPSLENNRQHVPTTTSSYAPPHFNPKQQDEYLGTERQHLLAQSAAGMTQQKVQIFPPPESHTHHMFHYGGPNNNGALGGGGPPTSVNVHQYDNYEVYDGIEGVDHDLFHIPHEHYHQHRRSSRNSRAIIRKIICYPFHYCLNDQLGRSFCFGAIDGMLTGAGILSACVGLDLLHLPARALASQPLKTEESIRTEWMLIALTLAACFSDGICMAVGHIWSTRLLAGSRYEERKEELLNLETSRSNAKARLVDSLLSKGMLKIDAYSLADTLEGYPDMFVSALLGEGFCGQSTSVYGINGLGNGGDGTGMVRVSSGDASRPPQQQNAIPQPNHMNNPWNIPPSAYGPGDMHHGMKYESYSDFSDYQQDPELRTFSKTMSDSRAEGLLMMISFGSFSVIPILIHSYVPYMVDYMTSTRDENNVMLHDHPPKNTTLLFLSLGINMAIMFLLGSWKSHFYSSHWCMFSMETVGVLLLCIASAYSVGYGCRLLINSHFG
eukprot:scaffold27152_cov85-Cyclotella_meneghiniana.AAC.5